MHSLLLKNKNPIKYMKVGGYNFYDARGVLVLFMYLIDNKYPSQNSSFDDLLLTSIQIILNLSVNKTLSFK